MPPKLGVIAGKGELPNLVVEAARAQKRPIFVLAIEGQTAPVLVEDVEHAWVSMGSVGRAIERLHGAQVEDVVFAGAIHRPSLAKIGLDVRAAGLLARMGRAALGDNSILETLIRELEGEGFRVIGADDVLSELVAGEGPFGRHQPDDTAESDIGRGVEVARALGTVDVGQAVVVQQGLVLGVEAIEGTDALIWRTKGIAREGPGGVLVKIKKSGQDRRADLPTIGVSTVRSCAETGLRGIAVEAGETLVLGRKELIAAADAAGLFVTGIRITP